MRELERCREKVIKPVKGDEIIWVIGTCARMNKCMKKAEVQFKYIKDIFDSTAWKLHVKTDFS